MRRLLAIALLQLPASVAFAVLVLLQMNTLAHNGNWTVSKFELRSPVMSAGTYVNTHHATHRNALDLGAWHGFQEVVLVRPVTAETTRISFDLRLDPNAYVSFLFNRTENAAVGIRLSRNPRFPSRVFAVKGQGRFQRGPGPLGSPAEIRLSRPLDAPRGHEVEIELAGGELILRVDGSVEAQGPMSLVPGTRIGFRGSAASAVIDDVRIHEGDEMVFHEGFFTTRGFWSLTAVAFAVLSGLSCALVWSLRRRDPKAEQETRFTLVTLHLVLAVVLWIVVGAVFLFRGGSYRPTFGKGSTQRKYLAMSRGMSGEWRKDGAEPRPGIYRIMIIGSSQTYGAGVARQRDAFPEQVQRRLRKRLREAERRTAGGRPIRVQVIKAAVKALDSTDLIGDLYLEDWIELAPQLVVVNLSKNDGGMGKSFTNNLIALADANRERGIDTMFVKEAGSKESNVIQLEANHKRMQAVADRYDIPVIPMHQFIDRHRDDGFIWWDSIHMTSFGYSLVADRLVDAIWQTHLADWSP